MDLPHDTAPNPGDPVITVIRYETSDMARIRAMLRELGHNDADIDVFRDCISSLEGIGFRLITPR